MYARRGVIGVAFIGLASIACREPSRVEVVKTPPTIEGQKIAPAGALPNADMPTSDGRSESAVLLSFPLPFATSAPVDAAIVFQATLPPGTLQGDVETAIRVVKRGGGPVVGSFVWTPLQYSDKFRADFLPSSPLDTNSVYEVAVQSSGTFKAKSGLFPGNTATAGVYWAAFSTDQTPLITDIQLISKDRGNSIQYVRVMFSEEMDGASVAAALSRKSNNVPLAGAIPQPVASGRDFSFYFQNAVNIGSALDLRVEKGAIGLSGRPINPQSYDSPTSLAGGFEQIVTAAGLPACNLISGCWEWMPVVLPVVSQAN